MSAGEQRSSDVEGVGVEIAPPAKTAPEHAPSNKVDVFDEKHVCDFYDFIIGNSTGVVEIRAIKNGNIDCGYFDNANDFVAACRGLNGKKQVYAGINPRPVSMHTKAPNVLRPLENNTSDADIAWVQTVVIDADPDRPTKTAATKGQVQLGLDVAERIRTWAEEQGWAAPPIVMSGNGAHAYFAFPAIQLGDEDHRTAVAAQLKNFESAIRQKFTVDGVKIDSISNFSRIIKVPGTLSIKGENTPERPHRRARYMTDHERVEDPVLREHILSLPTTSPKTGGKTKFKVHDGGDDSVRIGDKPNNKVMRALFANKNLMARWEGRGKTGVGPDGQSQDTSRSAYDWAVAMGLIRAGITSLSDLATAVRHRPGGKANDQGQGDTYAIRTATKALSVMGQEQHESNFKVIGATVTNKDPRIFRLHTSLGTLKLSAEQLRDDKKFDTAFANAFGTFPLLDSETQKWGWTKIVNGWLEGAAEEKLSPDASDEHRFKLAVLRAVEDLAEGQHREDLDSCQCLLHKGKRVFKADAVDQALNFGKIASKQLGRGDICDLLIQIGCRQSSGRIGGKKVAFYVTPEQWPEELVDKSSDPPARPRHNKFVQLSLPGVDREPWQLRLPGI